MRDSFSSALKEYRDLLGMEVSSRYIPADQYFEENFQEAVWDHRLPQLSICLHAEGAAPKDLQAFAAGLAAQVYENWELIVVSSTETALQVLTDSLVQKQALRPGCVVDCRIPQGLSVAASCIRAASLCKGYWLTFMTPFDLLSPLFTQHLFEASQVGASAVYDFNVIVRDRGEWKPKVATSFDIDRYREYDYLEHHFVAERKAFQSLGGLNVNRDNACFFDFVLRASRHYRIGHLQDVMVFETSRVEMPYQFTQWRTALWEDLRRRDLSASVRPVGTTRRRQIFYAIEDQPLVSIIIPSKDSVDDLRTIVTSIQDLTTYGAYEIVVVENNSCAESIQAYDELANRYGNVSVVHYEGAFNYSKIVNFGAAHSSGQYVLILNNDMKVISAEWLTEMVRLAQLPDVGVVGGLLKYFDGTIQHAGVVLTYMAEVLHNYSGLNPDDLEDSLVNTTRRYAAMTGACQLVERKKFEEVGGYDERFQISYSDIDLCYKLNEKGYRTVLCPRAQLYHFEGKTRGHDATDAEAQRFLSERELMMERFRPFILCHQPIDFTCMDFWSKGCAQLLQTAKGCEGTADIEQVASKAEAVAPTPDTVGAVVVTYNRLPDLKQVLASYDGMEQPPAFLVVVDNHSNQDTEDYLNDWSQQTGLYKKIVCRLPENRGGAGGFKAGIQAALDEGASWVFVADDDAVPCKDVFQRLAEGYANYNFALGNRRIAALCTAVDTKAGFDLAHRRRVRLGKDRVLEEVVPGGEYAKDYFAVDEFSYVGTLMNAQALREEGLTEDQFFLFYDDTEHSLRLGKWGDMVCIPAAKTMHKVPPAPPTGDSWKDYYAFRNQLLMIRRHFPRSYFLWHAKRFFEENCGKEKWRSQRQVHVARRALFDALANKDGLAPDFLPGS